MIVGFDHSFAEINQVGTGVYVGSLASALKNHSSVSLCFFSVGQKRDSNKPKTLRTRLDTLYRDLVWMHAVLPSRARMANVDLLHMPANISPLYAPCPVVLTIHDTILYQNPKNFPVWQRNYFLAFGRKSARHADHIITVSESSKNDIIQVFGVSPGKITSIPIAVSQQFRHLESMKKEDIRARYGLGRFILTVGTIEPRKNLVRLIEAFESVQFEVPGVQLVHVGPRGWHMGHLSRLIAQKGLDNQVLFLGKLPLNDLVNLYNSADVFAYPSIYEGFGLPVLEAMACGSPVVTSNLSSMPEVAGDAAILVDPYDVPALAKAIIEILKQPDLADEYRSRGLLRAKDFSWQCCAEETIRVYQEILGK